MTEELEEVKDPQALLTAYNKLKADLRDLATERDSLKSQVAELNTDQFRIQALTAEAKLALAGQGIKDVDRLMPYIGTEGLDFDDKGQVTGLNERLETLKKDLPEVFDAKVRAGGKADIHATSDAEVKTNPLQAAVRNALNN